MRIRIRFAKTGALRYIGHLDLFRSWERTFRRSGLPLAYSQGYHPQPRLNLACALPLGFTSDCELIDAWLEDDMPVADIQGPIEAALPPGLAIFEIKLVEAHLPALQIQVRAAVYVVTCLEPMPDLEERIKRTTSAKSLPRQRRGKPYDLRPLIEEMEIIAPTEGGCARFRVQLAAREAATGRPEELLEEMGIIPAEARVHRENLLLATS